MADKKQPLTRAGLALLRRGTRALARGFRKGAKKSDGIFQAIPETRARFYFIRHTPKGWEAGYVATKAKAYQAVDEGWQHVSKRRHDEVAKSQCKRERRLRWKTP